MKNIALLLIAISLVMLSCKTDANNKNADTKTDTPKTQQKATTNNGPKYNVDFSKVQGSKPKQSVNNGSDNNTVKRTHNNPPNQVITRTSRPAVKNPANKVIMDQVPNACDLVSAEFVANVVSANVKEMSHINATTEQSPYTNSCFYRWPNNGVNDGILLQVQANPVAEEYAEWVTLFVESKKTDGERAMQGGGAVIFKDLDGLGDAGAYSHELGKYIWRSGNDFAFTLTFRSNSAPAKQLSMAKKIGQEVMRNYAKLK